MARKARFSLFTLVAPVVLGLLGWGCWMLFQDLTPPSVVLTPNQERVSPTLPLTVTAEDESSPIKRIRVAVRRNDAVMPVADQTFTDGAKKQSLTFTLQETGLRDTAFDLEITVVDGSFAGFGQGNSALVSLPMRIDVTPPRISVKSSVPYMRRGGTGCVVYGLSKEPSQTGVKVGELFFPGFRQENGDFIAFFAYPHYLEAKDYAPQIMAVDQAGNTQVNALNVNRMPRAFKADTLNIGQGFLDAKADEFLRMVPAEMSDIERYLQINGRVRRENAQELMKIGRNTSPVILWEGAFLRLPDAAPKAGFADHRTYLWEGKEVDQQTHLGLDLASLAQAEVPASNTGNVVFVGYLGIYGNTVIIDHGLGLQSLYAHLTDHQVEKGQTVKKGQIIGHTGTSGLTNADHLHYGILISGMEVSPIEWLDAHWIKDNVSDRIIAAGGKAPRIGAAAPAAPARQAAPRSGSNSRQSAPRSGSNRQGQRRR